MKIELLQKGEKYLVRYKDGFCWWYAGHPHDTRWQIYAREMDLEEAEEVIQLKKDDFEKHRETTTIVRQIEL